MSDTTYQIVGEEPIPASSKTPRSASAPAPAAKFQIVGEEPIPPAAAPAAAAPAPATKPTTDWQSFAAKQVPMTGRYTGAEGAFGPEGAAPKAVTDIASGSGTLVPTSTQPYPSAKEATLAAGKVAHGVGVLTSPLALASGAMAPVKMLAGAGVGYLASKGAGKIAEHYNADPDTKQAIEELAFWAPTLVGELTGLRGGAEVTPEGSRASVSGFQGRAGAGVAITPEEIRLRGGVGPFRGEKVIPRGGRPAGPGLEPPTIEGQQTAPAGPPDRGASALVAAAAKRTMAARVAQGLPPVEPTPPPPGPPAPADIQQGHISAETVASIAQALVKLPPSLRAQGVMEAHETLSKVLLEQGKMVGPDGKLHIIENEKQASSAAQSIINDEVARQEKEFVRNSGEEPGKGGAATKPEAAPQKNQSGVRQSRKAQAAELGKTQPAIVAEEPMPQPTIVGEEEIPNGSERETHRPGQREELSNTAAGPTTAAAAAGLREPGAQPEASGAAVSGPAAAGQGTAGSFPKGSRIQIGAAGNVEAEIKHDGPIAGQRTIRVKFDEPTKLPWMDEAKSTTTIPKRYHESLTAAGESKSVQQNATPDATKGDIIFARHGATKLDQEGSNETVAGWTSEGLDDRGRAHAEKLAKQLDGTDITQIISSDLERSKQTAEIVGKKLKLPVKTDRRLRPQHVPETEGLKIDAAKKIWNELEAHPDEKPEGGESWNEFTKRQQEAIDEIEAEARSGERPLVMTHSRNLEAHLGERPEPGGFIAHTLGKKPVFPEKRNITQHGFDHSIETGPDIGQKVRAEKPAAPRGGETVGTAADAARDTELFAQAKKELGEGASVSAITKRAQELKTEKPKEETRYKFGSTQANIPAESDAAKALETARGRISKGDLAGDGKDVGEGGNHVTVRYGITGDDTEAIKNYLAGLAPFEATLGPTAKFPPSEHSEGAAVIVAPIEAPQLHKINRELENHGDFKKPDFDYKPHATIAYVKPEVADRYVGMSVTAGKKFTIGEIAITDRQGNAELVKLGGEKPAKYVLPGFVTHGLSKTPEKRIDYDAMNRAYPKQKAALTRAEKIEDIGGRRDAVINAAAAAVAEWEKFGGAWPDNWSRWQRAVDDAEFAARRAGLPAIENTRLEDLETSIPVKKQEVAPVKSKGWAELQKEKKQQAVAGPTAMADAVYDKLASGQSLGNVTELNKLAEEAWGASRTSGVWSPKDAFDAMEAGINKYLLPRARKLMAVPAEKGLEELRDVMTRITSQGVRTDEQIKNQQFSTPPTEAYIVAKVADLKPSDIVLEPSAGNGGLAIWAKALGAEVHVNEIAPRRRAMLKAVGFDNITAHDGELINTLLDPKVKPTVIVMNPPFSASTQKSHEARNLNRYGFNHVDQALQRLADGGRLVTILGGGHHGFNSSEGAALRGESENAKWFAKIGQRYNIRANVRVSGKEYQKYGTAFSTRIIVIDKTGPTPGMTLTGNRDNWASVKEGDVADLEEAYTLLRPVAEDRVHDTSAATRAGSAEAAGEPRPVGGVAANRESGVPSVRAGAGESGKTLAEVPAPTRGPNLTRPGAAASGSENRPEQPRVPEPETRPVAGDEGEAARRARGGAAHGEPQRQVAKGGLDLEQVEAQAQRAEEDESAYTPYKATLKGTEHPGSIVETKSMATVPMPPLTYKPHLPESIGEKVSAVQMEAVAIAGMQNDIVLPGGFRASALIGDGTGVGKGREGAAILWDNWRQGRKRLVWMTKSKDLMQDAIRDLEGIGAKDLAKSIQNLNKIDGTADIKHEGVLFTTYSLFRSADKKGNTRAGQVDKWLRGQDGGDGGYLLMDESHNLKNAVVAQGEEASQIGAAVKKFLQAMPALRTVSLSATAATDVMNLGYLDRLGLWGEKTPFPGGFSQFAAEIAHGGMSAMEMIARELKAQGKYVARTLTFRGVKYTELEHTITEDQKKVYATAAKAWRSIQDSIEHTIQHTTNGGGRQKAMAMSQFYSTQQRFFGLLLTSMKIPTAVEAAEKALAEGRSVGITLINTNEAAQNREKDRVAAEDSGEEPDYDFGPGRLLKDMVEEHYPTQQYKDDVDSNGMPIKVPMVDAAGHPVQNPQAVKERDQLIAKMERELHMPNNPLDDLIEQLGGPSKVAELTGRKQRFDPVSNKLVNRGGAGVTQDKVNLSEMQAFQSGKKRIAVLSSAADTGISLHADKAAKNQQPRLAITLQVGWSADKAMQMMGRFNRSNQVAPPEYTLLKSDLGGESRFISSIARRMESLEALSKGQTKTNAGTDAMSKVNFETDQGRAATVAFYNQLLRDIDVPGTEDENGKALSGRDILKQLGVLKGATGAGETVPPKERDNVTRLLNRLLGLEPKTQNAVYDYFYDIFDAVVKDAIENGSIDTGVKRIPGDSFTVKEFRQLAADPTTGAKTFYYPVEAEVRTERLPASKFEELYQKAERQDKHPKVLRNEKGQLMLTIDAKPIVRADGKIDEAVHVLKPGAGSPVKVTLASLHSWKPVDADQRKMLEDWQKQYEAAPTHHTSEHHLIGGAVMRYWNPIREATEHRLDVYSTVDAKSGQRVVGVEIPASKIQNVLSRISGGASTVDASQIIPDVLKNAAQYELEGGIKIRRGSVAREKVVQFTASKPDVLKRLVTLGVIKEMGVQPIYYLPTELREYERGKEVLEEVLKEFPVKQSEPIEQAAAGETPAAESKELQTGDRVVFDKIPPGSYLTAGVEYEVTSAGKDSVYFTNPKTGAGTGEKRKMLSFAEFRKQLVTGESGSLEPGKLGEAALDVAGAVKSYLTEAKATTKIARNLELQLETLNTRKQARILRAREAFLAAKAGGLTKDDDEAIYHHLEDPEAEQLTDRQENHLDDVMLPIAERNEEAFTELTQGGVPLENYVHRTVKGKGGTLDRIAQKIRTSVGARGLSKSAPQTKQRVMMAIEDNQGNRRVVSIKGGQVTAWDRGAPENLGGLSNTEEGKVFEDKEGTIWNLRQATTREIEDHTELEYYHSALASLLVSNIQLESAVDAMHFIDGLKTSPEFKDIAWQGKGAPPKTWKTTQLPQFQGFYFEPRIAEVLDRYADSLKGGEANVLDQVGKFMRLVMLLNPLMHAGNVGFDWLVEKGLHGFFPTNYVRMYRTGSKALHAVLTKNDDFKAALDQGAALQSHRELTRDITKLFYERLAEGLDNKEPWAMRIAEAIGLTEAQYAYILGPLKKLANWVAWHSTDFFMLQSAYEKQDKGMSFEGALQETSRILADYRVPTRIADSALLSKMFRSPKVFIFGPWHYHLLKAPFEMGKAALGLKEPTGDNSKAGEVGTAWSQWAMVALLMYGILPWLDDKAKELGHDSHLALKRFGILGFMEAVDKLAKREAGIGATAQRVLMPSPLIKGGTELLNNRESYSGRQIVDPHASWSTQRDELGHYVIGEMGQIGQAERAWSSEEQRKKFWLGQLGLKSVKTATERVAADIAMSKVGSGAIDPEEQLVYSRRREIIDALRRGDGKPLSEARAKRQITLLQEKQLRERAHLTPLQDTVHGFSYAEVMRVYEAAKRDGDKKAMGELEREVRQKRMNLLMRGERMEAQRAEAEAK